MAGDNAEYGGVSGGAAVASVLSCDRNATQFIAEICIFTESIEMVLYDAARL